MSDADGVGTAVTGALLAHEVQRAAADRPAVGHPSDEPCVNCGTVRVGPYCHRCGQVGHVHRTAGALVHDIAHGVFHFEGKLWATLPLLAWRPGALTRRYVAGERAKFVSPMALFLFSVFLMFAVVSGLAGHGRGAGHAVARQASLGMEAAKGRTTLADHEAQRRRVADPAQARALDQRIANERKVVATLTELQRAGPDRPTPAPTEEADTTAANRGFDTGVDWLNTVVRHAAANPELLLYKMKSYGYKYSWALIPLSLPFLWLLFAFRRDVGLYDHAIFATYSLAFMSLGVVVLVVLSALGVPTALVVLAVLIVPPWHMYRQLKGAYALGRLGAAWRTLALLAITLVTSFPLFLALLLYLGSE